jgi:Nucleotidyl transferase AbiEii toxin, Type IV TA system
MVDLGIANSRMKDFYDLRFLASCFSFEGPALLEAFKATFERRGTMPPDGTPPALTAIFAEDGSKQEEWAGFLRRSRLEDERLALTEVVAALSKFLLPPLRALKEPSSFSQVWPPGGPWHARDESVGSRQTPGERRDD